MGRLVNNSRDGSGTCTWPNGYAYDGEWRRGQWYGWGQHRRADGATYEGLLSTPISTPPHVVPELVDSRVSLVRFIKRLTSGRSRLSQNRRFQAQLHGGRVIAMLSREEPRRDRNSSSWGVIVTDTTATTNDGDVVEAPPPKSVPKKVKAKICTTFSELSGVISEGTLKALAELKLEKMTPIQSKTLSPCLAGKDVVGKSKSGSGKTLAFLIPAVERLLKHGFPKISGVGVVVISVSREYANQVVDVAKRLTKFTGLTVASLDLSIPTTKTANLVVAVTGRGLCQAKLDLSHFQCLVLDDADMLLTMRCAPQLRKFISTLPAEKQTMVFSRLRLKKPCDLLDGLLRKPTFVGADGEQGDRVSPESVEQQFMVCTQSKLDSLISFLCSLATTRKVLVLVARKEEGEYIQSVLTMFAKTLTIFPFIPFQDVAMRNSLLSSFKQATSGVILSNYDNTQAKPSVDWVVMYDIPNRLYMSYYVGTVGNLLLLHPLEAEKHTNWPLMRETPCPPIAKSISEELTAKVAVDKLLKAQATRALKAWKWWLLETNRKTVDPVAQVPTP
ncbi:ATP-dependent RNA helicase DDX18 [Pelomyxa schiedti]|nr:ATP-dependent RNA helicase DDX18 [Pelomyxa schiedti]